MRFNIERRLMKLNVWIGFYWRFLFKKRERADKHLVMAPISGWHESESDWFGLE